MEEFAIIYFISFFVLLCLGIYTYFKSPDELLNKTFLGFCLLSAYWSLTDFGLRISVNEEMARYLIRASLLWPFGIAFLLHFMLVFTRKSSILNKKIIYPLIYLPPAVFSVLYLTLDLDKVQYIDQYWGFTYGFKSPPIKIMISNIWGALVSLICVYLIADYSRKAKNYNERKQAKYFLLGMIIPIVVFLISTIINELLSIPFPDLTNACLTISALFIGYAVIKYKMFILTPVYVVDYIVSTMSEALIVTNSQGIIETSNNASIKLLGINEGELLNKRIESIFVSNITDKPEDEQKFDLDIKKTYINQEVYIISKAKGKVPVSLSNSVIIDKSNKIKGVVFILKDLTELKKKEAAIKHRAFHDHLTELPNRQLFYDRMEIEVAKASRHNRKFGLIYVDLDNFKQINDKLGHDYGDILLKSIASRLISCKRNADTVARIGGDEFIFIISEIDNKKDISFIAERILNIFNNVFEINDVRFNVGASLGISVYPEDSTDIHKLIKLADDAMYKAKQNNGNNYQFYKE